MSWNDSDNQKKPSWSGKDEPPDLEQVLKNLHQRLFSALGGEKKHNNTSGQLPLGWVFALIGVIYGLSGIYIVQPAEKAVITRFGQYHRTEDAGPHWFARGIEKKMVVDVEAIHTSSHAGHMLTHDENIVHVEVATHYRIEEPKDYLFRVDGPEHSLSQVTDSALRYVVGHSTLDQVLTRGRSEIALAIKDQIKLAMEDYQTGLAILDVAMQPATPPEAVKSAFDDVIRAQEDEQRYINEADAYAKKIEPIAAGQAKRIEEEAQAYAKEVILMAEGESQRFLALLPAYQASPEVTQTRLYIAAMTQVLSKTSKMLLSADSNQLNVLPLDHWLQAKPVDGAVDKVSVDKIAKRAKAISRGPVQSTSERGAIPPIRDAIRRDRGE